MRTEDIPFAVEITDEEGWGYMEEDFKRLMDLEPEGCFVAFDRNERVGMLTTTSYGDIGWIGNVVVRSDRRQERIGAEIVRHAVGYLKGKPVSTLGLYSYMDSIKFYEGMGFSESFRVARLASVASASKKRGTNFATRKTMPKIEVFDRKYFPGDRSRLLGRMLGDFPDFFFYVEEEDVLGYILGFCSPKACEIGPWVCDPGRPDVAEDLLVDCLTSLENTESAIAVPVENTKAVDIAKGQGFTEEFQVSAMFFESDHHGMNLDAVFGIGALEKG